MFLRSTTLKLNLKYLRGAISIVIAAVTPFGAYASGETSLRAAFALGAIASLIAIGNWLDQALANGSTVVEIGHTTVVSPEGITSVTTETTTTPPAQDTKPS